MTAVPVPASSSHPRWLLPVLLGTSLLAAACDPGDVGTGADGGVDEPGTIAAAPTAKNACEDLAITYVASSVPIVINGWQLGIGLASTVQIKNVGKCTTTAKQFEVTHQKVSIAPGENIGQASFELRSLPSIKPGLAISQSALCPAVVGWQCTSTTWALPPDVTPANNTLVVP